MAMSDEIRCCVCGDPPEKPIRLADARVVCWDCYQEAVLANADAWEEQQR